MADLQTFLEALESIGRQAMALFVGARELTQSDFVIVHSLTHIEVPTMSTPAPVLAPPLTDPTSTPRRTDRPRVRVRSVGGALIHTIPATDARNLTGHRAGLWDADWEIVLVDEHGTVRPLECHTTGSAALAQLPFLLRQVGLLNADGTRPAPEGGASDVA